MTKFYRSQHHDIPIKEESSLNLALLLLNGAGTYPCALRVCACMSALHVAYVCLYCENLARRRIIATKELRFNPCPNCNVCIETYFKRVTLCK